MIDKLKVSLFALGAAGALAACSGGSHASSVVPSAVVPSAAMLPVDRFRFEAAGLVLEPREGAIDAAEKEVSVAYRDLVALIRASHRHTFETQTSVKERKLRPIAAIATGGLILSKTVTRDVRGTGETREQVLFHPAAGCCGVGLLLSS